MDAELNLIFLSNPSCSALVCPTKTGLMKTPRLIHQNGEIYVTSRVHIQEIQTKSGGLEHEFYDFPYIGKNHPN